MEDGQGRAEQEKPNRQGSLMSFVEKWSPITFLIPQGTGILATILFQLDWQFRGSEIIATIVWILTILLLAIFGVIYIVKIILFPKAVRSEVTSDIMALCCLSSPSITFGTIVNMVALVCAKAWGPSWGMVAYVLSWINVFIAFVVAVGVPYTYFRRTPPGIDSVPPSVLLPAISPLTAASACGIVCYKGELSARLQVPMIITGYVLLGFGLADSVTLIGAYMVRLVNGGFPNKSQLWMNYILVGPLGQASAALQLLGKAASTPGNMTFASYNRGTFITASAGQVLQTVGTLSGLLIWSYAAWWMLFSLAMTVHLGFFADGGIRKYSLSAWSSVFPWASLYSHLLVGTALTMD
ncbi:MAG: hypothetical protein L6R39_007102 [Caloplaca ligustica]|nr:MAG: hypothetical protein L6R39_007102 [Caloplaca ligustica]